jgi:hypothetical protein
MAKEYQNAFLAILTIMLPSLNALYLGTGRVDLFDILKSLYYTFI